MSPATRAAFITLEQLHWSYFLAVTGGPQPNFSSSPFLWTVFFKVDAEALFGDTVFTPGDHDNLGVGAVSPGAVVSIPDIIGTTSFGLSPITAPNGKVFHPTFGLVAVLMKDGGHVTPHGIAAGHQALNFGVRAAIDALAQIAIAQGPPPTPQQIDSQVQSANLSQKVTDAVIRA